MRNIMSPIFKAAAFVLLVPFVAHADLPGKHPYYLHALSDLRAARWFLDTAPGDAAVSGQEDVSIAEIDAAIGEIKHAAIDDGKDIHDHFGAQDIGDRPGRLHEALDLLNKVQAISHVGKTIPPPGACAIARWDISMRRFARSGTPSAMSSTDARASTFESRGCATQPNASSVAPRDAAA